MITHIEIEHFKSINYAATDLDSVSLFVGNNASGKSNIVDAIRFVRDAISQDLDAAVSHRYGIDSIREWSKTRPYNIKITLSLKNRWGMGRYSFVLGSAKTQYRILKEEGFWTPIDLIVGEDGESTFQLRPEQKTEFVRGQDGPPKVQIGGKPTKEIRHLTHKDDLFMSRPRALAYEFRGLSRLASALSSIEIYSIYPNTLRATQALSNDPQLNSSGANLNSIFKAMTKSRAGARNRAEILDALKAIMPNFENIEIRTVGGQLTPLFRVIERDGEHLFNVSQVSDGTLRMLGLLTAIYQMRAPETVGLEEPEQNLNPGAMSLIAEAVKDVSDETQVLMTTHSPDFMDFFDPESIRLVRMTDEGTTLRKISEAERALVRKGLFTVGAMLRSGGLV